MHWVSHADRVLNQTQNTKLVGKVVGIWRYPVKSMAAEALTAANVSWYGIEGDRRWAFVRGGVERSGFPWMTNRQRPDMWKYEPYFVDPDKPDSSPTVVRSPSGREYDVDDPALAAELGHDSRVIKQDRGIFDAFPLSLMTTQTVSGLEALVGKNLDALRFRPNILVEASSAESFPEDQWVGRTIQIGEMAMRVDKRDGRCSVVNVNPETSEIDPSVLKAIAKLREGCLGVYGSTVKQGRLAMGDSVYLVG